MKSPDELLKFALRFAQMELPTRKAEWDMLRREIAAFVDPQGALLFGQDSWRLMFRIREGARPEEEEEKDLAALPEEVRNLIAPPLVVDQGIIAPRGFPPSKTYRFEPAKIVALECGLVNFGGHSPWVFLIEGDTHDLFLGMLIALIMRTPANRIRTCRAPGKRTPREECGKRFLRIGRKIYCSETCAERDGKQARRKRQQPAQHTARRRITKTA